MTEKHSDPEKKPMLVIYHGNCPDGFAAAFLLWKSVRFPPAEYIAGYYGEDPPDVKGREVVLVDFCYSREDMLKLKEDAYGIACFDHHETAFKECGDIPGLTIDKQWCGCILTYTHLEQIGGAPYRARPQILEYIDDRDRGLNRFPNTREVNAAIRSYPYTFKEWDKLFQKTVGQLKDEGVGICRYMDQVMAQSLKNAAEVTIGGHKVLAANCTAPMCAGDVATKLAEGREFGVSYHDLKDRRIWELRTDSNFDVSVVAKKYGGGGHKGAAGFHTGVDRCITLQKSSTAEVEIKKPPAEKLSKKDIRAAKKVKKNR